jgi:multidrug efflux system outer membrane protein
MDESQPMNRTRPQHSGSQTRLGSWAAAALLLLTFAGCALGPDYRRPATPQPETFRGTSAPGTNSIADLPWWKLFQDPTLVQLVGQAMTNNYDLKRIVAQVEQARQQITVARSPLFPQLGYQGVLGRGQNSVAGVPSLSSGQALTTPMALGNLSWELDVWGQIRRMTEAARAQYLATQEGQRNLRLMITCDVASAYLELLTLDAQLAILRNATNAYAGTLKIFQDRLAGGVASRLETDRAGAALEKAAASVPEWERRIVVTENAINLLLGRPPGNIPRGTLTVGEQTAVGPEVPTGLTSDLLRRRPDIAIAEQDLIAANAMVGANKAQFFPTISLTAAFGQGSTALDTFTAGSSRVWSAAAGLTGPIFQAGRIRAQYRASKAAFEGAVAQYDQSILTALRDVSNALTARQKYIEVRQHEEKAVAALESAVTISTERYLNGKASYFEVLEAQQQLYPTQSELAQARFAEANAVVDLYRALGGGWSLTNNPTWTQE